MLYSNDRLLKTRLVNLLEVVDTDAVKSRRVLHLIRNTGIVYILLLIIITLVNALQSHTGLLLHHIVVLDQNGALALTAPTATEGDAGTPGEQKIYFTFDQGQNK